MKKIIGLSLVLLILSVAASAQRRTVGSSPLRFRNERQLTGIEKVELGKDALRYKRLQRKSQRDGVVTPFERKRLRKARTECRRDAFRFKHNNRRRVI